ncbi:hypothetical protein ACP4OV_017532 [Aristida adscensionis]
MFPFSTVPVDDLYNPILDCSRQEHILPDTDDGGTASGVDAAAGSIHGHLHRVAVRRLLQEDEDALLRARGEKGGGTVGVFQPSHEERQVMGHRAHNQTALAEISFSDMLLASGMSTFGYMSSILAGLRPTMLLTAHERKVPGTPCVARALSMEPCFHKPSRVECQGNKAVDKEDLQTRV